MGKRQPASDPPFNEAIEKLWPYLCSPGKAMSPERWQKVEQLYHAALEREPDQRASAITGDTAKSRKAYQDFFALWKDADADIPVLQQAGQEYAKLK